MTMAILEDDERRIQAMIGVLERLGRSATVCTSAPEMIDWLGRHLGSLTLLSLDHDLGPNRLVGQDLVDPGIGRDVVDWLVSSPPQCPVIIHSSNAPAADGMVMALESAGWSVRRVYPYGDLDWIESSWLEAVQAGV